MNVYDVGGAAVLAALIESPEGLSLKALEDITKEVTKNLPTRKGFYGASPGKVSSRPPVGKWVTKLKDWGMVSQAGGRYTLTSKARETLSSPNFRQYMQQATKTISGGKLNLHKMAMNAEQKILPPGQKIAGLLPPGATPPADFGPARARGMLPEPSGDMTRMRSITGLDEPQRVKMNERKPSGRKPGNFSSKTTRITTKTGRAAAKKAILSPGRLANIGKLASRVALPAFVAFMVYDVVIGRERRRGRAAVDGVSLLDEVIEQVIKPQQEAEQDATILGGELGSKRFREGSGVGNILAGPEAQYELDESARRTLETMATRDQLGATAMAQVFGRGN